MRHQVQVWVLEQLSFEPTAIRPHPKLNKVLEYPLPPGCNTPISTGKKASNKTGTRSCTYYLFSCGALTLPEGCGPISPTHDEWTYHRQRMSQGGLDWLQGTVRWTWTWGHTMPFFHHLILSPHLITFLCYLASLPSVCIHFHYIPLLPCICSNRRCSSALIACSFQLGMINEFLQQLLSVAMWTATPYPATSQHGF